MTASASRNEHPLDTGIHPTDRSIVEKRPEWCLAPESCFSSDFGVLGGQIILSRSIGDADGRRVAERIRIISDIVKTLGLSEKGFCLIEDFERLTSIDLDSRAVYIDRIRKIPGLRGIAFCQVSNLMRFVIRLGRTFNVTAFPVEVVPDVAAALRKARRWLGESMEITQMVAVDDFLSNADSCDTVDDFIRILGSVAWDKPGAEKLEQVIPSSPWKPVSDAMVLIKKDLDRLISVRTQRLKELQEKNAHERRLQAKMAFAIEESRRNRQSVEAESQRKQTLMQEVIHSQKELLFSFGEIIESRSRETANHIRRVSEYSALLGQCLGLSSKECVCLLHAAPMHDAGKIAIPDAVLNKPGKLDDEEFDIMKTHAARGFELFRHSSHEILCAAAIIAHEHHEKWNGRGYPRGLAGEQIHIFGRITALSDVFDALGSDRCYKKAWPLDRILQLLKDERGQHFDPAVTDAFFSDLDGFLAIRERFPDVVT